MRLIASLAVVVGLLLLAARLLGRRLAGREGAPVRVLHRHPLTRSSSVAVVAVGSRILVLGTTDQQVRLLTELDPDELDVELSGVDTLTGGLLPTPRDLGVTRLPRRAGAHRAASPASAAGPLAGSVLSARTWRQALAAATGKAS
jgi:flagellar protein FliO/FliZ